jgi:hypothetical protein
LCSLRRPPQLQRDGLAGLVAFIESQSKSDLLTEWDPQERNTGSHDGKFLGAIYYSTHPPKKERADDEDEPGFSAIEQQVKEMRKAYAEKATSGDNIPETLDDGVSQVVKALNVRENDVGCELKDWTVNQLKEMCGQHS